TGNVIFQELELGYAEEAIVGYGFSTQTFVAHDLFIHDCTQNGINLNPISSSQTAAILLFHNVFINMSGGSISYPATFNTNVLIINNTFLHTGVYVINGNGEVNVNVLFRGNTVTFAGLFAVAAGTYEIHEHNLYNHSGWDALDYGTFNGGNRIRYNEINKQENGIISMGVYYNGYNRLFAANEYHPIYGVFQETHGNIITDVSDTCVNNAPQTPTSFNFTSNICVGGGFTLGSGAESWGVNLTEGKKLVVISNNIMAHLQSVRNGDAVKWTYPNLPPPIGGAVYSLWGLNNPPYQGLIINSTMCYGVLEYSSTGIVQATSDAYQDPYIISRVLSNYLSDVASANQSFDRPVMIGYENCSSLVTKAILAVRNEAYLHRLNTEESVWKYILGYQNWYIPPATDTTPIPNLDIYYSPSYPDTYPTFQYPLQTSIENAAQYLVFHLSYSQNTIVDNSSYQWPIQISL